jgi:hypothetical protein
MKAGKKNPKPGDSGSPESLNTIDRMKKSDFERRVS